MNFIEGISDQPTQNMVILLDDGTQAAFYLEYRTQQLGWFYDISWNTFEAKGVRFVASPNILRQYRNVLPFGISVTTVGNVEPLNQRDFVDGIITMVLLQGDDLELVEETAWPS